MYLAQFTMIKYSVNTRNTSAAATKLKYSSIFQPSSVPGATNYVAKIVKCHQNIILSVGIGVALFTYIGIRVIRDRVQGKFAAAQSSNDHETDESRASRESNICGICEENVSAQQILRLLPNCLALFDDKLNFWESVKSGGFAYCSHCGHNFSKDAGKKRCPSCAKYSCLTCKEKWLKEHERKSCEEYQELKFQNSVTDITSYFKDIVIECPRCNSSFQSLGGCLHYRCTQCSYEFCGICGESFFRRDKGLDCYHHRNCLGNLRDIAIEHLETLLDINKVEIANVEIGQKRRTCLVESCEKEVSKLNICRQHYKEYLIQLINKNDLEVIDLWDQNKLAREFNKLNLVHPRNRTNNLNKYSCMRAEFIRQVPLKKIRVKRL